MTLRGPRPIWLALTVTIVVGLAATLVGCSTFGPTSPVAVSDVKSLAGKWGGVIYRAGHRPTKIDVTIREDGSYDVVAQEGGFSSSGKGTIVLRDGRLIVEGQRGTGVATPLSGPGGQRILRVEMTLSDNSYLSAQLEPSP